MNYESAIPLSVEVKNNLQTWLNNIHQSFQIIYIPNQA